MSELSKVLRPLSAFERRVVRVRLRGRSFAEIGRGFGCSRQAVQQAERRGLARLGVAVSLERVIVADERLGRATVMRDRGLRARGRPGDGMGTRGTRVRQDAGAELSDALMAEIEAAERAGRELSADRWAYYAERIGRALR
jgi:hypothetical protein